MNILLVLLLCFSIGCSTVESFGVYQCEDGRRVTYVKGVAKTISLSGGMTLLTVDRYLYDPVKNETTLIRSDTTGAQQTGNPWDSIKSLPVPIPF